MNISEVSAAGKRAVGRDTGKRDIAVAAASLVVGGMDIEAAGEGRCDSLERAICAT
jgi:hypothetical protein